VNSVLNLRDPLNAGKLSSEPKNIRGLNLAAVMCTTVQVSRLPW
jgi:hypothetical protein